MASWGGQLSRILNPVFSENSWDDIQWACENDAIPEAWKTGDTKTVTLTDGQEIEFVIANNPKDTDNMPMDYYGVKVPIVLASKTLLSQTSNVNSANTTNGGYVASNLRCYIVEDIYNLFPKDVQSIMTPVSKATMDKAGDASTTQISTISYQDLLWAPSSYNISGAWWSGELQTTDSFYLPYFADNQENRKLGAVYYTGSPSVQVSSFFAVNTNGNVANSNIAVARRFMVCFGIGKKYKHYNVNNSGITDTYPVGIAADGSSVVVVVQSDKTPLVTKSDGSSISYDNTTWSNNGFSRYIFTMPSEGVKISY